MFTVCYSTICLVLPQVYIFRDCISEKFGMVFYVDIILTLICGIIVHVISIKKLRADKQVPGVRSMSQNHSSIIKLAAFLFCCSQFQLS